jgi:hypothetical protein
MMQWAQIINATIGLLSDHDEKLHINQMTGIRVTVEYPTNNQR